MSVGKLLVGLLFGAMATSAAVMIGGIGWGYRALLSTGDGLESRPSAILAREARKANDFDSRSLASAMEKVVVATSAEEGRRRVEPQIPAPGEAQDSENPLKMSSEQLIHAMSDLPFPNDPDRAWALLNRLRNEDSVNLDVKGAIAIRWLNSENASMFASDYARTEYVSKAAEIYLSTNPDPDENARVLSEVIAAKNDPAATRTIISIYMRHFPNDKNTLQGYLESKDVRMPQAEPSAAVPSETEVTE